MGHIRNLYKGLTITVGLFLLLMTTNTYAQETNIEREVEEQEAQLSEEKESPLKKKKSKVKKQPSKSKKTQSKKATKVSPSETAPFNRQHVGLGLGQTFLMGKFDSLGEDKLTFDLYYAYRASYTFQLLTNFHSHTFSLAGQQVRLTSANMGIKAKLFDFDAFSPFITGGLGLYWPQAHRNLNSSGVITKSKSKTTLGVNLGVGADLELNDRFTVGLLAHYHYPFKIKQDNQPSIRGHYLKVLMTIMYSF